MLVSWSTRLCRSVRPAAAAGPPSSRWKRQSIDEARRSSRLTKDSLSARSRRPRRGAASTGGTAVDLRAQLLDPPCQLGESLPDVGSRAETLDERPLAPREVLHERALLLHHPVGESLQLTCEPRELGSGRAL